MRVVLIGFVLKDQKSTNSLNDSAIGLITFAVGSSTADTTFGGILDRVDDAKFFLWTQRIILVLGALFIGYAIYRMKSFT